MVPSAGRITMLDQISTRIFADGTDLDGILVLADDPRIAGCTPTPTLMRKVHLSDYARFADDLRDDALAAGFTL